MWGLWLWTLFLWWLVFRRDAYNVCYVVCLLEVFKISLLLQNGETQVAISQCQAFNTVHLVRDVLGREHHAPHLSDAQDHRAGLRGEGEAAQRLAPVQSSVGCDESVPAASESNPDRHESVREVG